jgi:hypothetical protein
LKEGQDNQVTLDYVDAHTFARYVHKLYYGKLPRPTAHAEYFPVLAKLYGLGEYIDDIALQNEIIDVMVAICRKTNFFREYTSTTPQRLLFLTN